MQIRHNIKYLKTDRGLEQILHLKTRLVLNLGFFMFLTTLDFLAISNITIQSNKKMYFYHKDHR